MLQTRSVFGSRIGTCLHSASSPAPLPNLVVDLLGHPVPLGQGRTHQSRNMVILRACSTAAAVTRPSAGRGAAACALGVGLAETGRRGCGWRVAGGELWQREARTVVHAWRVHLLRRTLPRAIARGSTTSPRRRRGQLPAHSEWAGRQSRDLAPVWARNPRSRACPELPPPRGVARGGRARLQCSILTG